MISKRLLNFGKLSFLLILCGILGGCAEVIIQKDGKGNGYDVYRPEPYLLVFDQTTSTQTVTTSGNATSQNKGASADDGNGAPSSGQATPASSSPQGLSGPGMTIVWLPNYSIRYRIHSSAYFLSKAGAQFTMQNGVFLSGVTDQSDNTALLTAAQNIFSSVLGSASSAAKTATGTSKELVSSTNGQNAGDTNAVVVKTNTITNTRQDFHVYKFLFNENGEFYGLAELARGDAINKLLTKVPPADKLKVPAHDEGSWW